jgi:hypothetical protein
MFFWCLLAIAFNHDQFQFIGNLLGGLKRLRCSKGPVKFGIGYGQKLGAPPLGFFLRSRNMPNPGFKSEVRRLRRGQDKILRHKLSTAFAQKKKASFWSTVKSSNKQKAGSKVQTIDDIIMVCCSMLVKLSLFVFVLAKTVAFYH